MDIIKVCDILNISKGHAYNVIQGRRKSPIESKIKYLLKFEDSFEEIIRHESFADLCEVVIKRAQVRKESKEVELAMHGKSLRNFLMNNFDKNDLHSSVLMMFERTSFIDKKMVEFINNECLESLCDIAMRSTKNAGVRKMSTTLKLIHQEFWKPKMNINAVSKV